MVSYLLPFLSNFLLLLLLIGISLKDFKDGIIPDSFLLVLALLGGLHCGGDHLTSVIILSTLAWGLYKIYPLIKKQEGLGLGDVKMILVSGIWLAPSQIPLFLLISGGIGIGISLLWKALKKGPYFPFGPALAVALGACIVGEDAFSKGEIHMTLSFSGPSLPPASGNKPDSLVVLIHGYGANGEDLLSLGKAWASLLPHTLFIAPDGPVPCEMNPSGNQWFGLKDWDPNRILRDIQSLTPSFNRYLDELLKIHGLSPERLALVGFSQGAMLALYVALHRPSCAGVVAYSGSFLDDPSKFKIARPPILLIHGTDDQIIPSAFSQMAEEQLKAQHIPVTLSLLPGLEHGIDGRGLGMGGTFLKEHLYENQEADLWEKTKESNN